MLHACLNAVPTRSCDNQQWHATSSPTTTPAPGTILAQVIFQRASQIYWGTAADGRKWAGDANSQTVFSINDKTGQVGNGHGFYNAMLGPTATIPRSSSRGTLSSVSSASLGSVAR